MNKPGAPADGCEPEELGDAAEAMRWFDVEYRNVLAAQQLAVGYGWYRDVCRLAWALESINVRRGSPSDRVTCWQAALTAAEQLADPTLLTSAHGYLARAHGAAEHDAESLDHFGRALAMAERHDDVRAQAYVNYMLSLFHDTHDDHENALLHATRSRDLYHRLPDPVWEAIALGAMGHHNAHLGHLRPARDAAERALALAREQRHRDNETDVLNTLGYIEMRYGAYARALDLHTRALELCRAAGSVPNEADTLTMLGDVHAAAGRRDAARACREHALLLYRQMHRMGKVAAMERLLDPWTSADQ